MGLSVVQRDTLEIMYLIRQQIGDKPIPSMKLLEILNDTRSHRVLPQNFRTSCHTLARHELIALTRHETSLKLSFALTKKGLKQAETIHQQRSPE